MMVNQRGQVAKNRTVAAQRHIPTCSRLDIQLTYHNTRDPATGRIIITNKVEHDYIMTFLEANCLTLTMVESKTQEFKPWAPAAVDHAKKALQQLMKDFETFEEIFPDLTQTMMSSIR